MKQQITIYMCDASTLRFDEITYLDITKRKIECVYTSASQKTKHRVVIDRKKIAAYSIKEIEDTGTFFPY